MVTAGGLEIGESERLLVVAPHPDDESLGCGGLIAVARRRKIPVRVVFMTDGSGSHRSPSMTGRRLGHIRRREARHALFMLGVRPACIAWMGFKDRFVASSHPGIEGAAARAQDTLEQWRPTLLVSPSGDDQHGDHRATAKIWQLAASRVSFPLRQIDYLIWPAKSSATRCGVGLDVTAVRYLKRQMIRAHRTQHGLVIHDDPGGFILPPALLAQAYRPSEIYGEGTPR